MPYIGRSTDGFGVRNRFLYLASADDTSVSGADANGATLTFTDGAFVDDAEASRWVEDKGYDAAGACFPVKLKGGMGDIFVKLTKFN